MQATLRLVPIALIAAALVAGYASGLYRQVTWAALAEQQAFLLQSVADRPARAALLYVATYAALIALSLPAAAIASVTGGLLFGPVAASLLTIVGASIGASIAFATFRTALFPLLARRAGGVVARIGPRLARDGLFYVIALRLLPVVPFWLVNLAAGLSGMPWRVFALGTLIGIIPATVIFSSVGAGIGDILAAGERPDMSVVFTPRILLPLLSLAALSLLPVAWRQLRRDDAGV